MATLAKAARVIDLNNMLQQLGDEWARYLRLKIKSRKGMGRRSFASYEALGFSLMPTKSIGANEPHGKQAVHPSAAMPTDQVIA